MRKILFGLLAAFALSSAAISAADSKASCGDAKSKDSSKQDTKKEASQKDASCEQNCCEEAYYDCCCSPCFAPPSFEISGAAFRAFDTHFRRVYNQLLPMIEFEASTLWGCHVKPWVNIGYVWSRGESTHRPSHLGLKHNKTHFRLIPVSFGMDYVFKCGCSPDFYIGAGATYSILRIHDYSRYVHQRVRGESWGFVTRAGAIFHICDCLFIDLFTKYFHVHYPFSNKHHEHPYVERKDLTLNTLIFGGGLGLKF